MKTRQEYIDGIPVMIADKNQDYIDEQTKCTDNGTFDTITKNLERQISAMYQSYADTGVFTTTRIPLSITIPVPSVPVDYASEYAMQVYSKVVSDFVRTSLTDSGFNFTIDVYDQPSLIVRTMHGFQFTVSPFVTLSDLIDTP